MSETRVPLVCPACEKPEGAAKSWEMAHQLDRDEYMAEARAVFAAALEQPE